MFKLQSRTEVEDELNLMVTIGAVVSDVCGDN